LAVKVSFPSGRAPNRTTAVFDARWYSTAVGAMERLVVDRARRAGLAGVVHGPERC